jgi:hypothetical protein
MWLLAECRLTLHSSGPPTALGGGWRQRGGLLPFLHLPSGAQRRRGPLNSNVRLHGSLPVVSLHSEHEHECLAPFSFSRHAIPSEASVRSAGQRMAAALLVPVGRESQAILAGQLAGLHAQQLR